MRDNTLLPFDLPAVHRKKLTVDFEGGNQSPDAGLLLLREAERKLGAGGLRKRCRIGAIRTACGVQLGDRLRPLDRLRHDPLMKITVGHGRRQYGIHRRHQQRDARQSHQDEPHGREFPFQLEY
jgi:hypothetical protein